VRRSWIVIALLLSLGVNLGLVGVAVARRVAVARWERVESGEAPPPGMIGRRFADELRLAPEKRRRFLEAQRRLADETFSGRREVFRLRDELRREVASPAPDRGRLEQLVAELARRQAELDYAFVEGMLATRAVLDEREFAAYLRLVDRVIDARRGGPLGGPPPRPFARRLP
jgi:predicted nucleic acid-binding Zn ribbon protein